MKSIRLTLLALAILVVSAVAGIAAYAAGVVDPGFVYGFSHDDAGSETLVIASVSSLHIPETFAIGTEGGTSGIGRQKWLATLLAVRGAASPFGNPQQAFEELQVNGSQDRASPRPTAADAW